MNTLTLYTDAKHNLNRFALCDKDGAPVWHGQFFEPPEHQAQAELESAKKAVWLAGKIKEELELNDLELVLFTDAQWLTYQDHWKQKGYVLTELAKQYKIKLTVDWIPGSRNPADKYTICRGFKKYQENDYQQLLD